MGNLANQKLRLKPQVWKSDDEDINHDIKNVNVALAMALPRIMAKESQSFDTRTLDFRLRDFSPGFEGHPSGTK